MRNGRTGRPRLVLGPLLRYVGETVATVWVETDRACRVEVLGQSAQTFEVAGHHYGLVVIRGLRPGSEYEYRVMLDGVACWPEQDTEFPPSTIRTLDAGRPLRLVFGSCRVTAPHVPPFSLGPDRHERGLGADALAACALSLAEMPRERWPDAMLLLGDQIYADQVGPATQQFIGERRDPSKPPGYEAADFTEYCFLYREAWSEPRVRWLLSTIPTAMIFDDHDVHDDWNISSAWCHEYRAKPWWRDKIVGAHMSYWIYQHLGNLSPSDLADSELWRRVREPGDAANVLSDVALRADHTARGLTWSYRRTFGRVRVVVIDSRGSRVLEDGTRLMIDEAEWQWVRESASGDWDHVVLATSLPVLLPAGIHALEAWNEAVCSGAWGKRAAGFGERARRAADLGHWAAFAQSFAAFERLLTGLATGEYGAPPASVTVVSGDIHHSYLAAMDFPDGTSPQSAVYQAVSSPIRNPLSRRERRWQALARSRPGQVIARTLAILAGSGGRALRWRIVRGPWFDNGLSTLEFDGRRARIRVERAAPCTATAPHLQAVCEAELS